jgi:hypothetical protein
MTKPNPIRLPALPPRNPLAMPTRCRRGAGRHGPTPGARRQLGRHALRRELQALHPPHL